MEINLGYERRKFYKEQEKLRKQYEEAGMTPEQIQAMYEFDLHQFNRDIAYYRHTQPLEDYLIEAVAVEQQPDEDRKFWWLDEIEDEELLEDLRRLSEDELEIIDKLAFYDYTQEMVSEELCISASAVCQRLKKIKKKISAGRKS